MKKVVSLLMTLALVFTLGIGAMAAEDIAPQGGTQLAPRMSDSIGTDSDSAIAYDTFRSPRVNWVTDTSVSIAAGEIFLLDGNRVVTPDYRLEPNMEFEFDVVYATADIGISDVKNDNIIPGTTANVEYLTEYDITGGPSVDLNGKLRLRSGKGTSVIKDAELKTTGAGATKRYKLEIETKDLYNTKQTETVYNFLTSGSVANAILDEGSVQFKVGHGIMSDDDIEAYGEDDTVTIYNETPIFKKKQIDRLVKNSNYKAIKLEHEDGSWEYEGRMNGMSDTNFYTTQDVIPAIMNKFDQDFKFLLIPAGASFPTNGEMRIDVSDVSGDWDRMFTYLYRNGQLTRINTTYDSSDDQIVFRTNYLGAFVMTDVEITDTSILDDGQGGLSEAPEEPSEAPAEVPGEPGGPTNPNTGLPVGMNLAMGMGAVALLSAGTAIIRKKR